MVADEPDDDDQEQEEEEEYLIVGGWPRQNISWNVVSYTLLESMPPLILQIEARVEVLPTQSAYSLQIIFIIISDFSLSLFLAYNTPGNCTGMAWQWRRWMGEDVSK